MNSKFKRIIPILFAIIVICSLIWYLFIYDTAFTRDMLVYQARFFEFQGNHSLAAWLYNQAYTQSDDNEAVAIELAEQYKTGGNYSKAESTLSSAIANNPTVNLYIALCKTYVEQDKLLDAVTMLDSIEDPAMKAQLDAIRPEAPTASPPPGFYNQYLSVTVTPASGTLYLSTSREYPTVKNPAANNTVDLVAGENTITALSIGENGLVSPLSVLFYTVGNVVEELQLKDSSINAALRQMLSMDENAKLLSTDLWNITSFTVPAEATSVEDLAHLAYLQTLVIENCTAESYAALGKLTQLTELTIRNCVLSGQDLMTIASAPNLQKLTITGCSISGIDALANAKKLVYLDLSDNAIKHLSSLSFLSQLKTLNLSHNALTNLNDLSALTGLDTLDVSYNSITSAAPLTACTSLTYLNISGNLLTNLTGIESLTKLSTLFAAYNHLTDITAVTGCQELGQLDISNNELTNISCLFSLVKLQSLDFSRNSVTTLPIWDNENALVMINGSYNKLRTISSLAGYPQLNRVVMDYNNISSVNALVACPNLIRVDVYGNPVTDVSALKEYDVVVNYTPR